MRYKMTSKSPRRVPRQGVRQFDQHLDSNYNYENYKQEKEEYKTMMTKI